MHIVELYAYCSFLDILCSLNKTVFYDRDELIEQRGPGASVATIAKNQVIFYWL